MRWFLHARVSSNKQKTAAQIAECKIYIENNMKTGDEVLIFDEGDTTSMLPIKERPVILDILDKLKKGDVLVVYKLNRLARTGVDLVTLYDIIIHQKKAKLISLCEPNHNPILIHAWAMGAEMEREGIQNNTKNALRNKRRNGELTGKPPYGWTVDPKRLQTREDVRSTGKPYLLIPCPKEQKNVCLMVKWYQDGMSFGSIVKELKNEGATNRNGGEFNKTQVHRVITRLKSKELLTRT
jgi:DNA invertase Pin-like site-specific DNA recombinase